MRTTNPQITICTTCRHKGAPCQPGYDLIRRLHDAIAAAGDAAAQSLEISGLANLTGCDRPCTVAYHATRQATHLFGDVDPDVDIADLLAHARACARHHDDLGAPAEPGQRAPAAVIAIENTGIRAS